MHFCNEVAANSVLFILASATSTDLAAPQARAVWNQVPLEGRMTKILDLDPDLMQIFPLLFE